MEPTTQTTDQSVPQAPVSSPSSAQLQAIVDYMPNVSIFGSKTVLLEWGADNRIRLFEMDFDANKATGVMFDAALTDIQKVTGTVNMLTFHIGDKSYRTLFAAMRTAGVGAVGVGIALNELKASGVNLWIAKLKQNGVNVKLVGWGKTFAIAIALVAVVTGIVIAVQLANGTF